MLFMCVHVDKAEDVHNNISNPEKGVLEEDGCHEWSHYAG